MKIKSTLIIAFFLLAFYNGDAKLNAAGISKAKHTALKRKYSMDEMVNNIHYDFAKIVIKDRYQDRLDQLAELINDKKYAVALRGYADSIGTYKGNWVLSQKRSDAVKDYLVSKGVPAKLIVSIAFGSTEPIASNKTAAGRRENRRVEIKLKPIEQ